MHVLYTLFHSLHPQDLEVHEMLVLTRKKNESIIIDNSITITVIEIRGDKVRLGVDAPNEIPVHRREVYDAINDAIKRSEAEQKRKDVANQPGPSSE